MTPDARQQIEILTNIAKSKRMTISMDEPSTPLQRQRYAEVEALEAGAAALSVLGAMEKEKTDYGAEIIAHIPSVPEYRCGTNNLTDAPFQLPPSLIMANAAVSISPSPGISVEAIERVLAKEDNEYTNEAERMLRRIRDLLQSGEYALISKEDRESAFSLAWDGALKLGNGEDGEAEACERESRKLLHLESL